MQFVVEAAGVAHGVPVSITPPERSGGCLTVGTASARSPGGRLWKTQEVIKSEQKLFEICLNSCFEDVSNVFMSPSWAETSLFVFTVDQSTQPWSGTCYSQSLPS